MSPNVTRRILLATFLVTWTSFLYLSPETIDRIAVEDGLIEYASAFCWAASSGTMTILFFRSRVVWYLMLAAIFFLCFGEELSWGQRLFGFATPEYFEQHNIQREFNIHNLDFFDRRGTIRPGPWQNFFSLGRMFSLFWFSYYCVLPRLAKASSLFERAILWMRLPIIPAYFGPFLVGNYIAFKYYEIAHPIMCDLIECVDRASASNLLGESREVYEAFAILLITIWQFEDRKLKGWILDSKSLNRE